MRGCTRPARKRLRRATPDWLIVFVFDMAACLESGLSWQASCSVEWWPNNITSLTLVTLERGLSLRKPGAQGNAHWGIRRVRHVWLVDAVVNMKAWFVDKTSTAGSGGFRG